MFTDARISIAYRAGAT